MRKQLFTLIFCIFFLQASAESSAKKYYLTLCAIFNNDAPWLREWIEYNKILGVEHFYLYNNESKDNFLSELRPYITNGEVTLINWKDSQNLVDVGSWVFTTQIFAYLDAIERFKQETTWMVVIDTDEFIVPKEKENLVDFLKEYEDDANIGGLAINWSMYGHSSYWNIPKDKLLIECLIHKATDNDYWSYSGKCIIKPEYVVDCISPHFFILESGKQIVTPSRQLFTPFETKDMDQIKLNHYYTRTLDFFFKEKISRKRKIEKIPWGLKEINYFLKLGDQQEDLEKDIFRFIPKLKERLGIN